MSYHFYFTDLRTIIIIATLQIWKLRLRNTHMRLTVTTVTRELVFPHSQMKKPGLKRFRDLIVIT